MKALNFIQQISNGLSMQHEGDYLSCKDKRSKIIQIAKQRQQQTSQLDNQTANHSSLKK